MTADVEAAVADAHRCEWAYVLAAVVRVTGDIDQAEECVQDAYAKALTSWRHDGIPARPGAWLTTVARRLALDRLRRTARHERALPQLARTGSPIVAPSGPSGPWEPSGPWGASGPWGPSGPSEVRLPKVTDDRLRLIFTCCHPALHIDAQVALTLRLICGLTTAETARAFLIPEPTMAARITRAKKKIAAARIPYRVPAVGELPARIDAVLTVVHLLYASGHTAPTGSDLIRRDLIERALQLARMLQDLLPDDGDVTGLLALIVLSDARTPARLDGDGQLVLLAEQDRQAWDRVAIAEGIGLVRRALKHRPPGRFALMAAIAAVHAEAPDWEATDWSEIVGLYDLLRAVWPSPVVDLNRAVAVGMAQGTQAGLDAIDLLGAEPALASYTYMASARAEFLRRLGRSTEARLAYQEAGMLSENDVERSFLRNRLDSLGS